MSNLRCDSSHLRRFEVTHDENHSVAQLTLLHGGNKTTAHSPRITKPTFIPYTTISGVHFCYFPTINKNFRQKDLTQLSESIYTKSCIIFDNFSDHLKNAEELCIRVCSSFFCFLLSMQNELPQIIIRESSVVYHIKALSVVIRTISKIFQRILVSRKTGFSSHFQQKLFSNRPI